MRSQRKRQSKRAIILVGGVMFAGTGNCLPKDYWYNFAGAGRTVILDTFADTLFTSITDYLFPSSADDDTTDTTTG
ncbi:MAG: hypothetical protein H6817_00290 [Phycisphaerales bacterium]|nr:hypothetical protein [Phycisphaerales bacterium]